jgi:hypothetical protein
MGQGLIINQQSYFRGGVAGAGLKGGLEGAVQGVELEDWKWHEKK